MSAPATRCRNTTQDLGRNTGGNASARIRGSAVLHEGSRLDQFGELAVLSGSRSLRGLRHSVKRFLVWGRSESWSLFWNRHTLKSFVGVDLANNCILQCLEGRVRTDSFCGGVCLSKHIHDLRDLWVRRGKRRHRGRCSRWQRTVHDLSNARVTFYVIAAGGRWLDGPMRYFALSPASGQFGIN